LAVLATQIAAVNQSKHGFFGQLEKNHPQLSMKDWVFDPGSCHHKTY